MKVLKFGGTSVGKEGAMAKVVDVVVDAARKGPVIVVASALCGITDELIRMANMAKAGEGAMVRGASFYKMAERHFALCKDKPGSNEIEGTISVLLDELKAILGGIQTLRELSPRTLDLVMSYGEKLSCSVLAFLLRAKGLDGAFTDGRTLIHTDETHLNAWVDYEKTSAQLKAWYGKRDMQNRIPVVTGFCGMSPSGETTTLGRGGGDLTASIIGGLLRADVIEVWTDVDGVMTANPRCVDGALVIPTLSYEEAMELSYFGAKVIYAPTMAPAMRSDVPLNIRNTFNPAAPGTFIQRDPEDSTEYRVRGITSIDDVALLNLKGSDMVGTKGVSGRLFRALIDVNVILISQASSEHSICLAVDAKQATRAKTLIQKEFEREIELNKIDEVEVQTEMSIIAIVGCQMKKLFGLAGLVTTCLGEHGINIVALAQGSSELNMSLVVFKSDAAKGLQLLHRTFFADGQERRLRAVVRSVHVFVNSRSANECMDMIRERDDYLFKEKNTNMKVVGVCGEKKMKLAPSAITGSPRYGTTPRSPSLNGSMNQNPLHLDPVPAVANGGAPAASSDRDSPPLLSLDKEEMTMARCASVRSLEALADDWEDRKDDAHSAAKDAAAFVDQILQHAEAVADGQRVSVVLVDNSEDTDMTERYAELLDNGVGIITSNRTLWDRSCLAETLRRPRFIWRNATGFPASTANAVLASRPFTPTDTLKIDLTAAAPHRWLLRPLHAMAGVPCPAGPLSNGSSISFTESDAKPNSYILRIETQDEATTIESSVVTAKPDLRVLFRQLISGAAWMA